MVTKKYPVTIELTFTKEDVKWLREKFDIQTKEDLIDTIWECIGTYMEM